jgi:pimeloyl-ACP methyl ester carboxylesterase
MKVRESLHDLPCLIIHGTDDEIIPYHHALELHKADAQSTLISLPKSSHNFVTAQDAVSIEAALKEFFRGL